MLKTSTRIPHNKPTIGQEEIDAVTRVLQRSWLIEGEETAALEADFASYTGKKYVLALNSCSSALHLSLVCLGVSRGDEVILPTYTCTALLNAIHYTGATPVLVDTIQNGCVIDPHKVQASLTSHTKAIITPHTFGLAADVDTLMSFGIPVIEDCAQALGSKKNGKNLGASGTISVFSLYTTKMVAAGQGGILATDDLHIFESAKDMLTYDRHKTYRVSYNYRMTDITASLARAQYRKLEMFIKRRQSIVSRYTTVQKHSAIYGQNYYRYILCTASSVERDRIRSICDTHNISTIIPISQDQLLHRMLGRDTGDFPNAERMAQVALSLPVYPGLTDEEIGRIVNVLEE